MLRYTQYSILHHSTLRNTTLHCATVHYTYATRPPGGSCRPPHAQVAAAIFPVAPLAHVFLPSPGNRCSPRLSEMPAYAHRPAPGAPEPAAEPFRETRGGALDRAGPAEKHRDGWAAPEQRARKHGAAARSHTGTFRTLANGCQRRDSAVAGRNSGGSGER